ncbi:tRNA (adenosine(37)-N6)-dimethylallyltransferase MiaA [Microlunatus antarcticus]|uniref:tRNA dimethylallyltransferase n=1 Tax=Microlunatus antarcticus TaxID=53388 RepID=A0A7W5JUG3_9ACTN|nr:tRNA (adenosine(37)-N6)-dimethylallyltransferase MiaA [Microlunatus antarcticus]MBB3326547.1 tRNA dimethylallyltransferase [Microlunatus antarcticus]
MTIVIVGPTASGKSGLAVALALAYAARGQPAEVVSADSMLVYRGMDVGTAKPSARERAGVVHHLVDVLDVTQTATVAGFQSMARAAVAGCRARGVVPILVGGSALYVRAVVDAFEFPGTDPALRGRLEAELAEVGPEALHARLAERDPGAAARIEPANGRRVVRALEVGEITGRPYVAELPERRYALPDVVQIGLDVPRPMLDERIRRRVDLMWEAGLVDEVRLLERSGLRDGVTASRALGYRQVLQHLDGEVDEATAREATVVATRKFARRQDGWFRKDERITWLEHDRPDLVDAALVLAGPEGTGA